MGMRAVFAAVGFSFLAACATQQADLNDIARRRSGLVAVLGIVTEDTAAQVTAYLDQNDVPYAVAMDPESAIWQQYAVNEPPLIAVVSRGGRLVRGWPGGVSRADLEAVLDQVVGPP